MGNQALSGCERLSGYDTTYFHFGARSPTHTLKCLVLDTTRRGRPLTLADVRAAMAPRLGLHPRARQRAVRSAHLPGRYTWVDDPHFDLDQHTSEVTLESPGDFDGLCGRLAGQHVDHDRPLWDATLVHGLDLGRQAVVLRIHHSVMDGIAAANTFRHFTTAEPGGRVPVSEGPWDPPPRPPEPDLRRHAVQAVPGWCRSLLTYAAETLSGRHERKADARTIKERDDLLGLIGAKATYGWTGARFGADRICAHGHLDFERVRAVRRRHDVTVNDVLVTLLGEAISAEARHRGEQRDDDDVAMFNIALDTDPDRLCGNHIMAVTVPTHRRIEDLSERLAAVHRTCADQIAITRRQQDRRSVRITDLWARSFALGARVFAYRIPTMAANVVTANVPASPTTRWLGDVEVVDFISYAVLVQPIGLNVTIYSYDDHLSVGVLSAPEVIDDPHRFLGHLRRALDDLEAAAPA
jgi:diacylglycerol O-acyltransferase